MRWGGEGQSLRAEMGRGLAGYLSTLLPDWEPGSPRLAQAASPKGLTGSILCILSTNSSSMLLFSIFTKEELPVRDADEGLVHEPFSKSPGTFSVTQVIAQLSSLRRHCPETLPPLCGETLPSLDGAIFSSVRRGRRCHPLGLS